MLAADSYVGAWLGQSWACLSFPAGLLSSHAPGSLICRNRGVTPSSVAPECLGDSKSCAGTRIHPRSLSYAQRGCEFLAALAMTNVFISRDAKLKGPKVVDWSSLGELH